MAWTAIPAYVLDYILSYQKANALRENLIAIASARLAYALGGSRQVSLPLVAAAQDAIDFYDVELNGTNLGGFTVRLRCDCRTDNAATSITPKLRNVTDGTDAGVGVACTAVTFAGANAVQTIAVVLAAGVKKYRLQGTPSNATNPTYVIGQLEVFADA